MIICSIYWKPEIGRGSKTYSQFEYTGRVFMSPRKRIGFLLGRFSTQLSTWWNTEPAKKWNKNQLWPLQTKKKSEIHTNLTRRRKQQTFPDSLSLNFWRRSARLCPPFLIEIVITTGVTRKTQGKHKKETCLLRWTVEDSEKTFSKW